MKPFILLTLRAVCLIAADATGKWTGTLTVSTSDGTQKPGPAYLVLHQEGAKLTGTAGQNASEQQKITEGKAENGNISFEVLAGSTVMTFALKQEGDEIRGDVTRQRQGQTQTAKLAVKFAGPVDAQSPATGSGPLRSKIESQVLGETREMIVHLPDSYSSEPQRRYPVIYVLDGTSQDTHTARSAASMARSGAMPELIVVGLPNVSGGRPRDYTPPFIRQDTEDVKSPMGRADRFLEFLKKELIPHVEGRYRTAPVRMLAGHSRGGLFVTYSLLADPLLFQARFAHSPALHREDTLMAKRLSDFLQSQPSANSFFYMSLGTKENEAMAAAFEAVRKEFAANAPPNLRWQADRTPGAEHSNNGELATPAGFRALYRNWPTQ